MEDPLSDPDDADDSEIGEPLSDEEFREIHRFLQQLALAAYPNPQRIGCPGSATLQAVAWTPWPADHPAYSHIKHCSPCLREMLDFQAIKHAAKN